MQISFEEEQQVFHLYNDKISYVIQVEKQQRDGTAASRIIITTVDSVRIR